MVSFTRFVILCLGSVAAIRLTVRDIADSSNAAAAFAYCKKSCSPITTLAGSCATETCLCPTVVTKGQSCVTCLATRNGTLAEEINETFQECITQVLPNTMASSDKCSKTCAPLFKSLAACKLSDTCVCSTLAKDTTCHKCLLKNDKKTATTKDIEALSASCALTSSLGAGQSFPHDCDYACLNVYLTLDTCLATDYNCLCSAGSSSRKVKKKTVSKSAFGWGTAACQSCVKRYDKTLAKEIKSIQNVCGVSASTVSVSTAVAAASTVSSPKTTTSSTAKTLYPRLIVPVQASTPNTAYGTQYITTVDSKQEVVVVFDIPYTSSQKCVLTFHLPGTGANPGSGTSAYTLSGSQIEAYELASEITTSATYANLPKVVSDLGTFKLKEGSSSTLSKTTTCTPGTAISIKLVSVGGTSLKWFEDYNAPAVGIVLN